MASVAFPAYVLGHDPTKRLIVVSYGSELAVKHANDCRAIISSPRYKSVFPALQVSRTKNTEQEIATTRGGFRLAASVGGALTGRGGDIIIIDDPIKPADALYANGREQLNSWYINTLLSRLDDKREGAIIIVMQRLHDDDLCGFVLKRAKDWTVLDLAAIAFEDKRIQIGAGRYWDRCAGDVLHPERESGADLDKISGEIGADVFAAQYQQRPIEPLGVVIKRDSVQYYEALPVPTKSHYILQSWDIATTANPTSDYSCCVTLLIDERKNYYVMDVLRERLLYHELKAGVISQREKYKPNTILIEEVGLGRKLVKDLKAAGVPVVGIIPEGEKAIRVAVQVEKFDNAQVFFPKSATWLTGFEDEIFAFPNGPHDDQIDALTQALAYERPADPFSDAALKGWENFVSALQFQQMFGGF